jgi:hypothetical protein
MAKKKDKKSKVSSLARKRVGKKASGGRGKRTPPARKPKGAKKKPGRARKTPPKKLGKKELDAVPRLALEAAAKPCLPLPEAVTLVRACSKAPADLPLSTPLGQLFPTSTTRNSFCQCVANGVPIDRTEVPCGAGTTLQDVVDAITC